MRALTKRLLFSFKPLLVWLGLTMLGLLSSCAPTTHTQYAQQDSSPLPKHDYSGHPADAIPKEEPQSRHGNASSYKVQGKRYYVLKTAEGYDKTGIASWYGTKFHGRLTSTREPYDMYAMTAASPNLPIPSYVHVTNLDNGRSIIVKINDRGPFKSDRIIDLSYAAAKKLDYVKEGVTKVRVTAIDPVNAQTILASRQKHENAVKAYMNGHAPASTDGTQLAQDTTRPVYFQVGAYSQRDKAMSIMEQVALLTNMNASISESQGSKGTLYLVNLGPIEIDMSNKVRTALANDGFENPLEVGG